MAQAATSIPGTTTLERRQVRLQKAAVLTLTVGPFAGVLLAVISLWGRGLAPADATLFAGFYLLTGLGITVGYHRLFTHRSFDAPRWVRAAFAVAGSMAVEGSVTAWVADHRRHHAFADKEGDPHSPHLADGEGLGAVLKGLWHAHMGWLFRDDETDRDRWAPDLMKDPVMVRIDRLFPILILATFALPTLIGFLITGTAAGAIGGLLWGGLARVFLLHHVTWSVNSVCHFFGRRPFETTDESTNNWPLALISFGESWHNNHHAFPSSAVHGLKWWQLDPGGILIRSLQGLGLAREVKVPTPERMAAKQRS